VSNARIDGLEIGRLREAYAKGALNPREVLDEAYRRIEAAPKNIWIERVPYEAALAALARAEERRRSDNELPLFGIPFAVKDNIDVAGLPTTAACPAFAYVPERSATVIERLIDAGALLVGKTNLDQFATGLVGTRSPYGACASAFDPRYIAGGSSSGSAVAVALGLTSFALGTDTAGSGRVPASFNNVVGYKPTRGVLSTAGVVPACRSLDCVSVLAASASDAALVLRVAGGEDAGDPYSRPPPVDWALPTAFRFGVPRPEQLEFFGDNEAAALYEHAVEMLSAIGGQQVELDLTPFRTAAELLYGGPWIAERLADLGEFLDSHRDDTDPIVYALIHGATRLTAADAFRGMHRLKQLQLETRKAWLKMDVMLLPTTGTTYTIEQVQREPSELNTNLGYYTNFVNLLDLTAVALPAGFRSNGLPFGVSLIGRALDDLALLRLADVLHRRQRPRIGSTHAVLAEESAFALPSASGILLAVVGAHLSGQPLNHELVSCGGRLTKSCRTARGYRLFALSNTEPSKPALVREPSLAGPGIEVEVWQLPLETFGAFVAGVPPPLGIGTVTLEDGSAVRGFVCESHALAEAHEITRYGGWRAYLAQAGRA
jgi:allophanate hydrolase